MKQKYKSGDLLVDWYGYIICVIGHSYTGHYYLCDSLDNEMRWQDGKWIDSLEKIGTL